MGKSTTVTCEVCGAQINRKADLKRHMMLHAENKEDLKHPCPYQGCTFKTLQKSNLTCHLNTHTGSRPYKCGTRGCKFKTSDRGTLTRHRKTIHGYVPSGRAKRHTAGAREAAKPSTSSSVPDDSTSPMEALPDAYRTPLPELPQTLESCSLLTPPIDCMTSSDSKSDPVVLRTDVFMGYPWVNSEEYPLVNSEASSSSTPGLLMWEEVPMLGHMGATATEQGNFQDLDLPAQSIPELTSSGVFDTALDDLFVPSNDIQTSMYTTLFAPSSTTVHNGSLPSPPPLSDAVYNSLLSFEDYNFIVDNTPVASGSQFAGGYDPATSIPSGCHSFLNNAGPFDFGDPLFAAPEMGIHCQDVDPIQPYTTPAQLGGYPKQGLMHISQ